MGHAPAGEVEMGVGEYYGFSFYRVCGGGGWVGLGVEWGGGPVQRGVLGEGEGDVLSERALDLGVRTSLGEEEVLRGAVRSSPVALAERKGWGCGELVHTRATFEEMNNATSRTSGSVRKG